jgi:hypothetical protein
MPIIAWLFAIMLFYTYFNPNEAGLYAPLSLFPLLLLMARGFAGFAVLPINLSSWGLAVLAILLAIVNLPTLVVPV